MNRSKQARLGLCLIAALTVMTAAFASTAPAAINEIQTEASTVYGSTVPGAHTDYTIIQKFQYDGNGVEPKPGTNDLKKWIVDSPAGLIGNPNAVPYADRCDPAAFDPSGVMSPYVALGSCPAASQVGEADVYLVNDAQSGGNCPTDPGHPGYPLDCLAAGFPMYALGGPMHGKIYILKTDPEVPVTLGTLFTSASYQSLPNPPFPIACTVSGGPPATCPLQPKTKSILAPVTNRSNTYNGDDGDFRIRTIPAEYTSRPAALLPTALGHASFSTGGTQLHISRIDQHLYGMVGGKPFLTMPTRCDSWDSISYAIAWDGSGGNLAMDPNNPGDNTYVKSAPDSVTPNCSTLPAMGATATASLSSGARNINPALSVTVSNPNAAGDTQVKKMVTTLPAAVSIDVDALANVCEIAQRNSDSCPAASQVGTATIASPLLTAGLTGRVYITRSDNAGLPNMSIFVDGAIKFRMDATTQFTGPSFNRIETTFDTLPQAPFTDFTVNIAGGQSNSLLLTRGCSSTPASWDDGPMTYSMNGYTGQASSGSSDLKISPCVGANPPATRNHCIKQNRSANFRPQGVRSIDRVTRVQLMTGRNSKHMRSVASRSKAPFQLRRTMSSRSYHRGWRYRYGYRITYNDGKIVRTSTAFYRVCR